MSKRIGVPEGALFAVVFASLAGGAINVPIARLPNRSTASPREVVISGVRYRLRGTAEPTTTTLAVNVGSAIHPDRE